ncbi:MAG: hypothetical protein M1828_004662 [Chrysothrix sp. TS-e1954]|nr:MAG: hypothetical protein M1828_004662 [Chrysothrix sp. TS-e1954]
MADTVPPFGALISSRPILTPPTPVSPNACAFHIPSQPAFSHIGVFLLPGQSLPDGTAALVFMQMPPSQEFKLLGGIGNEKQSAIFKVNVPKTTQTLNGSTSGLSDDVMIDDATVLPQNGSTGGGPESSGTPDIVLGISIEPKANAEAQLASLRSNQPHSRPQFPQAGSGQELVRRQSQQTARVSTQVLAQRIIGNAFDFLSGFAEGSAGGEMVPLKSFQQWWEKFRKKIELDPGFLENND